MNDASRAPAGNRLLRAYGGGLRDLDRRIPVIVAGTFLFLAARMSLLTFLGIFFVEQRGIPIALVGGAFFVENVVRGLAGPASGALSDRVGRLPVLLGCVGLTAVVVPGFLLVHGMLGLFVWSIAMGFVQGPFFPSAYAMLLDLAPETRRHRVLALNYMAIALGYSAGVIPGGFIAGAGFGWLALASVAGFLAVGAAFLWRLRGPLPQPEARAEGASFLAHTLSAARDGAFVRFSLFGIGFPLGIGLISLAIPIYGVEGGLEEQTVGLVLGLNGILVAAFTLPVNARLERWGPYRLLPVSAFLLGASYLLLARGAAPTSILMSLAVFSMGEIIFSAALPQAVDALAPRGSRGAYQGAWSFVFAVGVGAALLVAGILRTAFGWPLTWVAFGGFSMLLAAGLALSRGSFQRVATARRAEQEELALAAQGK